MKKAKIDIPRVECPICLGSGKVDSRGWFGEMQCQDCGGCGMIDQITKGSLVIAFRSPAINCCDSVLPGASWLRLSGPIRWVSSLFLTPDWFQCGDICDCHDFCFSLGNWLRRL